MTDILAYFLEKRGYSREYISQIENQFHEPPKDADKLCDELRSAHRTGGVITIYSDFDTDGITAAVTSFAGLAEMGFRVNLYIPSPLDGYGFDASSIDAVLAKYPDTTHILTCDVGTTCYDGIDHALERGIRMLVTDHHRLADDFDDRFHATVFVNPMRHDDPYPHKGICGAYVIFQVLQMYARLYCSAYVVRQIERLCVFAGIGTVADSMPMLYENRQLVRDAISVCRLVFSDTPWFVQNLDASSRVYRRAFLGLYYLLNSFRERGKLRTPDDITEEFLGFYIVPAMNSVKRMQGDMTDVFSIFFAGGASTAASQADILLDINDQRKELVASYMADIDTDQPYAPYVYVIPDLPTGIAGLIATNLMKRDGLPTLVVTRSGETMVGSGRSPSWYPLAPALIGIGVDAPGHDCAFGVHFAADQIAAVFEFIRMSTAARIDNMGGAVSDTDAVDFVINQERIDDTEFSVDVPQFARFLHELQYLKPFGPGFEAPTAKIRFRAQSGLWRTMGHEQQHLSVVLPSGLKILCWNQAEKLDYADYNGEIAVTGQLQLSYFNNSETVNFVGELSQC